VGKSSKGINMKLSDLQNISDKEYNNINFELFEMIYRPFLRYLYVSKNIVSSSQDIISIRKGIGNIKGDLYLYINGEKKLVEEKGAKYNHPDLPIEVVEKINNRNQLDEINKYSDIKNKKGKFYLRNPANRKDFYSLISNLFADKRNGPGWFTYSQSSLLNYLYFDKISKKPTIFYSVSMNKLKEYFYTLDYNIYWYINSKGRGVTFGVRIPWDTLIEEGIVLNKIKIYEKDIKDYED
jgi:hypothetical protein